MTALRRKLLALAGAGLLIAPGMAQAGTKPATDCALGDAPFSSALPLIDLLLSPQAATVVARHMPGATDRLPKQMFGTTPPSFAAIITLKELAGMGGRPEADSTPALSAMDAELKNLPVTPADRVARCARYDNDRPDLAIPPGRPRLLLFEKINGFKDTPSVNAAHAAFLAMAKANGWSIAVTDKGGAITPASLRRFDAVIWNNISGDVLTLSQRAALKGWLEHGGAFIGVHGSAGDSVYWWDWYVDDLIGARFAGHPFPRQFQTARVVIDDPASPIAAGLPKDWSLTEEWYSFKNNPRANGAHIIATLDESTYDPTFMAKQDLRMGKDHPIIWTRCIGAGHDKGRMFYSAIGHRPEMYADPRYVQLLTNAVNWATGKGAGSGRAECRAESREPQ
jgi:type 1 glutamine amidotransferase